MPSEDNRPGPNQETLEKKVCPECGHVFQGSGWDGIDAHWRAKHEDIMPYGEAWPQLKSGNYKKLRPEDYCYSSL